MNRKHLSLIGLAIVLVALGIAFLPFGWRDPYKARVDCGPAVVSAWDTKRSYQPNLGAASSGFDPRLGASGALTPNPASANGAPTACANKARIRLEKSGVLLALTALGFVVGRRILRPEPLPAS